MVELRNIREIFLRELVVENYSGSDSKFQNYAFKGWLSLETMKLWLWTMSDMVKYRPALQSFLKITALVFYHV
jgi:hypothetical protein